MGAGQLADAADVVHPHLLLLVDGDDARRRSSEKARDNVLMVRPR
jgi:hypothetical protein